MKWRSERKLVFEADVYAACNNGVQMQQKSAQKKFQVSVETNKEFYLAHRIYYLLVCLCSNVGVLHNDVCERCQQISPNKLCQQ